MVAQWYLFSLQGREGKIVQVYRKKWVIHIERITREKVNGECSPCSTAQAATAYCICHENACAAKPI